MSLVKVVVKSEIDDFEVELKIEGGQELLDNVRNREEEMKNAALEAIKSDWGDSMDNPEKYTAEIVVIER